MAFFRPSNGRGYSSPRGKRKVYKPKNGKIVDQTRKEPVFQPDPELLEVLEAKDLVVVFQLEGSDVM